MNTDKCEHDVFKDLEYLRKKHGEFDTGKGYISPEVYNIWINDNRTVKKRLKDIKKLLKKMINDA